MSNSIALAKFSSLLDSAGVMVNDTAITSVVDSAYVALRSPAGSGGISNVVDDTTPQLGGNLDTNGYAINGLTYPTSDGSNGQIITTDGSGNLSFADASGVSTGKAIAMSIVFGG